jgi:hypothetical protein
VIALALDARAPASAAHVEQRARAGHSAGSVRLSRKPASSAWRQPARVGGARVEVADRRVP